MWSLLFCNNLQLQCQLVVPPYILTIFIHVVTTGSHPSHHYLNKKERTPPGERNPIEAIGRDQHQPEPIQIPVQELQHPKENELQDQYHQSQRHRIHPRTYIWCRKKWVLRQNPYQLSPERIIGRRLPWKRNPRGKTSVFGAPKRTE